MPDANQALRLGSGQAEAAPQESYLRPLLFVAPQISPRAAQLQAYAGQFASEAQGVVAVEGLLYVLEIRGHLTLVLGKWNSSWISRICASLIPSGGVPIWQAAL